MSISNPAARKAEKTVRRTGKEIAAINNKLLIIFVT